MTFTLTLTFVPLPLLARLRLIQQCLVELLQSSDLGEGLIQFPCCHVTFMPILLQALLFFYFIFLVSPQFVILSAQFSRSQGTNTAAFLAKNSVVASAFWLIIEPRLFQCIQRFELLGYHQLHR